MDNLNEAKLEVHDKQKRYYLRPFQEKIEIEKEPNIDVKVTEEEEEKEDVNLVISEYEKEDGDVVGESTEESGFQEEKVDKEMTEHLENLQSNEKDDKKEDKVKNKKFRDFLSN